MSGIDPMFLDASRAVRLIRGGACCGLAGCAASAVLMADLVPGPDWQWVACGAWVAWAAAALLMWLGLIVAHSVPVRDASDYELTLPGCGMMTVLVATPLAVFLQWQGLAWAVVSIAAMLHIPGVIRMLAFVRALGDGLMAAHLGRAARRAQITLGTVAGGLIVAAALDTARQVDWRVVALTLAAVTLLLLAALAHISHRELAWRLAPRFAKARREGAEVA